MSSIVKAIVSLVAVVVVTLTLGWVVTIAALFLSEDFKDWYLEQVGNVLGLFGISDEDVIDTQVIDQRLIPDDTAVSSMLTELALQHQKTQLGIIDLMCMMTNKVRGNLNEYFNYGDTTYSHGLPDTDISAAIVPLSVAEPIIETEFGHDITVISSYVGSPDKMEWVGYKLWQLYGYKPYNQELTYSGNLYIVKYVDYNYGTNQYDITMYRPANVTVTTVTEVTVTVTPIDATTDNKHTYTKVTVTTVHSIEGTSEVITETNIDEVVPKGSVVDSYTIDTVVDGPNAIEYGTIVISVAAYVPNRHYVVKFYWTNDTEYYFWCYEIGSGNTALDNANEYTTQLEMLPIIAIRNAGVNLTANKTSPAYIEANEILTTIGVSIDQLTDSINENPDIANIQDAFVYFGLELKEGDPLIARMFYNLFDFMFYDLTLVSEGVSGYSATTQEGVYNSALVWQTQSRAVVTGVLGPIDTYTLTISGENLILKKQETETQYVQYTIGRLAALTLIQRGGLYGSITKTITTGGLVIPLSKFFVDGLSPIEQMEVFNKSLRLSIYAAEITHLEWYETPAFMDLIQGVLIVIGVVLFILSLPAGGAGGKAWLVFAGKLLLMYGATLAFKALLEATDNPWLKALLIVVGAVILYQTGMMSNQNLGFLTADMVTTAVTQYTEMKMEELSEMAAAFGLAVEKKMDELEEKSNDMAGYLSTEFVAKLSNIEEMKGFIEGTDMNFYKAVQMQYDHVDISIRRPYETMYDYDKYYKLGVV